MKKNLVIIGFSHANSIILQESIISLYGNKFQFIPFGQATTYMAENPAEKLIFLIYLDRDDISARKNLWQLKMRFENQPVILCSDDRVIANLAWQSNSLHFLPFPLSRRSLALMIAKIEFTLTPEQNKIKLNYQGGFNIITPGEICYCVGDGNYTKIFLRGTKMVMLSKKIKDISTMLAPFPDLVRIGKSFVININNIVRVDNSAVIFRGLDDKNAINFSPVYLKRIKEQILWILN